MDDLDHRNLGVKLKLWHLQEDAPGMVFWHPRGYAVYRVWRTMSDARCAEPAMPGPDATAAAAGALGPQAATWTSSAEHTCSGSTTANWRCAEPMSCPCHVQIFNKGCARWRELPIRYAESAPATAMSLPVRSTASCGRAPSAGRRPCVLPRAGRGGRSRVLHRPAGRGLPRPGFPNYEVALATRRRRAPATTRPGLSEAKLGDACGNAASRLKLIPAKARSTDRSWNSTARPAGTILQCGTVALDGVLPQRLEAFYVAPDGSRARPLMIHHAIFGSLSRMIAILLEQHGRRASVLAVAGPVAVAPISKDQAGYGADVLAAFEDAGSGPLPNDGADTLSRRIVAAHENGVPVMAIVGGREMRTAGESARARRLTGRRCAGRGGVRLPGEARPGALWLKRCKTCFRRARSVDPQASLCGGRAVRVRLRAGWATACRALAQRSRAQVRVALGRGGIRPDPFRLCCCDDARLSGQRSFQD